MNLLDFLKQNRQKGLVFETRTHQGTIHYYVCPCGGINRLRIARNENGFNDLSIPQTCQTCGQEHPTNQIWYEWPTIQRDRPQVFEVLQIEAATDDAISIRCARLTVPTVLNWGVEEIKHCLQLPFEIYEEAIHTVDGTIHFQSEQSSLTHDLIVIGDTSYQSIREKDGNPVIKITGTQRYKEEVLRESYGEHYLLDGYFKEGGFRQMQSHFFLLKKDPALKNHAVFRRNAFYALDWEDHVASIGHFFHLFHYFHWMLEVYPAFEQIAKSGYHNIISHWLNLYYVNPTKRYQVHKYLKKGTKESQIIAVPVFIRRWLKETNATFETYKKLLQIHEVSPIGEETFDLFLDIERHLDLTRLWRIIRNQHASFNEIMQYLNLCDTRQAVPHEEALILWDDYLNMAKRCELPAKRFPQSVKLAHDVMLKNFNEIEDQQYAEQFSKQAKINQQWEYQDDALGYALIVPKTIRELIEEGRTLRHCVGSYDKRVAKGQTVILFLRPVKDLTTPLYTVEWNPKLKEIVQARGKMNGSIHDPNALALLDQFKAKFA